MGQRQVRLETFFGRSHLLSTTNSRAVVSSTFGPLITRKEVAAYFSTTERHVEELRASGRLAYVPVGRFIRFSLRDCEKFIEASRVQRISA
jgi:excisionase family DNA binding protein